ncbi:hypothetical protein [Terribacillus saccharophilus]|uniref:Uncharacterized protein n=1 Tax=Terribacillus saccharophilus TaxID=361277 RepID=A0A268ABY5_9BACI|nr:hypothetical protein [Terribacillus saccharophilus]PAD21637.1 hypothetical protein CHH64_07365 [Terribacillus saccharophilus]
MKYKLNYKRILKTDLIAILICIVSFLGINFLNFKIPLNRLASGNGNLAYLGFPFAIGSSILIVILSTLLFLNLMRNQSKVLAALCLIVSIGLFIYLYFSFVEFFEAKVDYFGGPPSDPNSFIVDMGWFNAYTNDMYFNIYSFLFVLALPLAISCIVKLVRR